MKKEEKERHKDSSAKKKKKMFVSKCWLKTQEATAAHDGHLFV